MSRVAAEPARARRSTNRPAAAAARSPRRNPNAGGYLQRSQLPLHSLAFLLPLLVIYEVGTLWVNTDPVHHTQERIIAFNLLQDLFFRLGSQSRFLPAMAVVAILLTWHIARNDAWRVDLAVLGGMLVECLAWAIPLFAAGYLMSSHWPLAAGWGRSAVLSIGAGIYEELVFRLIAFTVLHLILEDWLKIEPRRAYLVMVVTSAVLFAAYHYLGSETFQWRSFVFRVVAGIYFGALFLLRGFGVTAGSHAGYDLILCTMQSAAA